MSGTALLVLGEILPLFIAFVAGLYAKSATNFDSQVFTRKQCALVAVIIGSVAVLLALNNRFHWIG